MKALDNLAGIVYDGIKSKGKTDMRILFIGNSHTYYNDLPAIVQKIAQEEGYQTEVTMIAHGGWYLKQHVEEPDVPFNIRYGHYDYVVLQEHSHPFDCIEDYQNAAATLAEWVKEADSTPVIYATWSRKEEEYEQARMNRINRELAAHLEAVLAPVGENWWEYSRSWPDLEMYAEDGAHASPYGSEFAAKVIWTAIREDILRNEVLNIGV